jgi:hypothetical protein
MKILNFLKRIILLFIMVLLAVACHIMTAKVKGEPVKTIDYKAAVHSAYSAYSLSGFEAAKEKTMQCAEKLYQKDLAEGKTEDKFEGTTFAEYFLEAFNECDEELSDTERLSLMLPVILLILLVIAAVSSIRLGLSSIRRLEFNNDAIMFNKK